MTSRFLSATALTSILLMSNAAAAQPRNDMAASAFARFPGWGYQHPNRCMVWDGYQWLDMCWRTRTFFTPAWARFRY